MLRNSKDPYKDFSRKPIVQDRIAHRLATRADAPEGAISLTIDELLQAHDNWQSESPEDPEALHRAVDDLWATKSLLAAVEASEGLVEDIGGSAVDNTDYRRVLYTGENMQLVLMSLKPGEEIGEEVHTLSQFLRIEAGQAQVTLDNASHDMTEGSAVVVPEGVTHNLVNTGETDLKLYSIYSPPQHPEDTVHATKEDAINAEDDEPAITAECGQAEIAQLSIADAVRIAAQATYEKDARLVEEETQASSFLEKFLR